MTERRVKPRVVFFDKDILHEAARRQLEGLEFAGIIFAQPLRVSIKQCIDDLEVLATAGDPEDFINQIYYIPL